ncbi:MAG: MarR family EPS-associated transcriptional regulator [Deltaproteobacteria bacterium]|nr:MarR family EPS-associated transcriptional regulator [Deltaproteobacteria bacterium]
MPSPQTVNFESREVLKLLQEIKKTPEMTQRELSSRLDISLGKINFLIRALIDKGFIKATNFKNAKNKYAYLYLLTPRGIEEKTKITCRFLKRKMKEYKQMEEEIRQLKKEVIEIGIPSDAQD